MKILSNLASITLLIATASVQAADDIPYVFQPGHASLKEWLLPKKVPFPADNEPTPERVALGKKLFFDPRLSGDGNMSCGSCHNPALGWSDGLRTAKGVKSTVLGRASPALTNTGYTTIMMWDGRKKNLEDQAMGPMEATLEMNMDIKRLFEWLNGNAEYKMLFAQAYPGQDINAATLSKAIASFERTIVSSNSPFDRWIKGDAKAMTPQQVEGFKVFAGKGNCAVCHAAPNFSDNGFHNIGLPSYGAPEPDMGRYVQKPVKVMKGAFKTPTLRDINRSAPYFHDGSAMTLMEVVEQYNKGGVIKTDLSPNIKELGLTQAEKEALVAFMHALTSPYQAVTLPELPRP